MKKTKSGFIDFKVLKQRIQIVDILDHYGLTDALRASGNKLVGACPICGGDGDRFRVSLEKNIWNCFGKECKGGNALDFVARKEGVPIREAALRIVEWLRIDLESESKVDLSREPSAKARKESEAPRAFSEAATNRPLEFALQKLDAGHPYLEERGLTPETIDTFGLGYCDRGIMRGRVVIPIHNGEGELVAYMGRWPGDAPKGEPRYKLPKGFIKSVELFNAHRAAEHCDSPLILVEGAFSAMKIHQAGFPRVAALFGSSLSDAQEELVVRTLNGIDHILLSLDSDEAGTKATEEILPRLGRHAFVRTVSYANQDVAPDEMTFEAIVDLYGSLACGKGEA